MTIHDHPEDYLYFIKYMNEEDYFEAHEVLEGYWHSDRIDFYKGLIQLAVGLFHLRVGNISGAHALLSRSQELLQPYRPQFQALDVERVIAYIQDCRHRIPLVREMERDEVGALGIEGIRLWLLDGTPIPTEVRREEEHGDE